MDSRRPLRVVHLITDLDHGGTQSMLTRLALRMNRHEVETIVVSMTTRGALSAELEGHGVAVVALGMRRGVAGVIGFCRLVRFLRQQRPVVLHTWLFYADLIGLIAGTLSRVPVIAWNIRAAALDPEAYSSVLLWTVKLLALLSRVPSAIVINSDAGREATRLLGYRPRREVLIPNGFDVDRFVPDDAARQSVRVELNLAPDTPLVGLMARFHIVKDQRTFLLAAARLHEQRPDVHFVLAGHGIDLNNEALAAWICEAHLQEVVHLLGDRTDVARLTAAFDVATLCSQSEAFPNVIGEAMACGVPCVATDVGECRRLIGDTGRIVKTQDPGALADAWADLLALPASERRTLGLAARERVVRDFDITSIAKQYQSLYESLVEPDASYEPQPCTTQPILKH